MLLVVIDYYGAFSILVTGLKNSLNFQFLGVTTSSCHIEGKGRGDKALNHCNIA